MKKLIILALCLGGQAFAKEQQTPISVEANVSVHTLRCVIRAQEIGSPYTTLGDSVQQQIIMLGEKPEIKLKHRSASKEGCELEKLSEIFKESIMTYGFVKAKIQGNRIQSKSRVAPNGKCIADIQETLNIDLGKGIVLSSSEMTIVSMKDCN